MDKKWCDFEFVLQSNEELILLLRMLSLGLNAWDMIDSQHFKEPKLEAQLITRFLPCLLSLMVDDTYNGVVSKLPDEPAIQVSQTPYSNGNYSVNSLILEYLCNR